MPVSRRPASRATFTFSGQIRPDSFAEFAAHRAARLSVALDTVALDATAARLCVAGAPDLLDAFEMAMSLGPADCLVREVERNDNDND